MQDRTYHVAVRHLRCPPAVRWATVEATRMHSSAILPYQPAAAACHPFDPRAARVAQLLANLICARMPDLTVEHVGSTSVPGCAGKGIVDLMVLYPPGLLAEARDTLDALGFQPQTAGVIHGAERPMRVGAVE